MIVAAVSPGTDPSSNRSLFEIIAIKHQPGFEQYRLVTQPDHANLSGTIAAALDRTRLPYLTDEIVQAIGTHDIGWLGLDGAAPKPLLPPYDAHGHLRSFLTTPPELFLTAWTGSISHAEQIGPTAGMMVSRHFERLAQFRIQRAEDSPADIARLHAFLGREAARQQRLCKSSDEAHATQLLGLLQFCDLTSLYLCCGVERRLDFSQQFGEGSAVIARRDSKVELQGVPLLSAVEGDCPAYSWRPGLPTLTYTPISIHVVATSR